MLNAGAAGLVLATVAVNLITCVGLLLALQRRLGSLPLRTWTLDTSKLTLAAAIGGLACWWMASAVNWPKGLVGLLLQNGLCAGLAVGLYGLIASAAGVPEVRQLLAMVQRRRAA